MKKLQMVLALVLVLGTVGFVNAQNEESGITTTFSVDYLSRYLFYGIDKYPDNDAAIQPSLTFGLWDTGFSAMIWGSWSTDGGHENAEELDYALMYDFTLMEDETLQTNVTLNWTYYDIYDGASKVNDQQELGAAFAMPNLVGNGVVPFYRVVKLWPAGSQVQSGISGWVHALGFNYGFVAECPTKEGVEQPINLSVAFVYNDSYVISESDWSHVNLGVGAPIDMPMGGVLTPSFTYQLTMEEAVNTDDELIFGVNYTYEF